MGTAFVNPFVGSAVSVPDITVAGVVVNRALTSGGALSGPFTLSSPTERDAGDLLVSFTHSNRTIDLTDVPTYDSDWTQVIHELQSGNDDLAVHKRIATDNSTDDWGMTATDYSYTERDEAIVAFDVTTLTNVAAAVDFTSSTAPTVTGPAAGWHTVWLLVQTASTGDHPAVTTPSGFTLLVTEEVAETGTGADGNVAVFVYGKKQLAAGATGTTAMTITTGTARMAATIYLSA